jgi:2-aminomuconate deaminase
MKEDFAAYNKIWAEYFSGNPPCRTTVEIKSLPTPIAIELKVIATI